jgi:hypothetical protein
MTSRPRQLPTLSPSPREQITPTQGDAESEEEFALRSQLTRRLEELGLSQSEALVDAYMLVKKARYYVQYTPDIEARLASYLPELTQSSSST